MSRRSASKEEPQDTVALNPRAVWACVVAAVVVLLSLGIWRLEIENRKIQAARHLADDPHSKEWFEAMHKEIKSFEEAGRPTLTGNATRLAQEVWVGEIGECRFSNRGKPEMLSLKLVRALRVAGQKPARAGSTTDHSIEASLNGYRFRNGEPQSGQRWILAVWRDEKGDPFVRDAVPWKR